MTRVNTKFSALAVSHISDLYPNVKYKLELLSSLPFIEVNTVVYDLGEGGFYKGLTDSRKLNKLKKIFKNCWGHILVFFKYLRNPDKNVYIAYPGIFLILFFLCLPKKKRPKLYLDGFISIYDTAINDRKMYKKGSLKEKIIYFIEKNAFKLADVVLTDTQENSVHYGRLFDLPTSKFIDIPLCIPALIGLPSTSSISEKSPANTKLTCLFVGSLVPLHGIDVILDAAEKLLNNEEIEFKIIGAGQEQNLIEAYLKKTNSSNLTWEQGFYPTEYITKAILEADVCLGVFGHSAKADRVLPYKLYYYSMLQKPFITISSTCIKNICKTESNNFMLVDIDNKGATLAKCINDLQESRELLVEYTQSSATLFNEKLNTAVIEARLLKIFNISTNIKATSSPELS